MGGVFCPVCGRLPTKNLQLPANTVFFWDVRAADSAQALTTALKKSAIFLPGTVEKSRIPARHSWHAPCKKEKQSRRHNDVFSALRQRRPILEEDLFRLGLFVFQAFARDGHSFVRS
ncbi:hypothetical protein A7E75_10800 [Syntrophotalea acetylenica]|jgi:hypothetical protein|uniref:Uncharacterized protein n=1 Tax=Syntrophotalea acetylenica TaxID=29542 RepID=A0A1L3GHP6_SYNAC|nr:hypothetical protein A7E75_10800 [Syntrophotalea acetylenica]APG43518.1 hypothetical protein A6070_04805 [Syntrophotalea acetylenica]